MPYGGLPVDGRIEGLWLSPDGARHELKPIKFWSTVRLEVHTDIGNKVYVKKQTSDQPSLPAGSYLFKRIGVVKEWPIEGETAANTAPPAWRKSSRGAKSAYDWDAIFIEAAGYMWENRVPKSLDKLCDHIEEWMGNDAPGRTQLELRLGPLYERFSAR